MRGGCASGRWVEDVEDCDDGDGLDVDDLDSNGGQIPVHGVELLLNPLGHSEPVEHLCKRLLTRSH